MSRTNPDAKTAELEIKPCLLLAPEHSRDDFRLYLSAAITKHLSLRSIYDCNPLAKALFTQTMAEFTRALEWMIVANTTFVDGEDDLKEMEEELTMEVFAAEPFLFDTCLAANGRLLEELFTIWPEYPKTAIRHEIAHVKKLFRAEFIDLRIPIAILPSQSPEYLKYFDLEGQKERAIRLLATAEREAEYVEIIEDIVENTSI